MDALALIYFYHRSPQSNEVYEEAVVWLWREWEVDRKWLTSAYWVCKILGVDLEQLRIDVGLVLLGWNSTPATKRLRYVAKPRNGQCL